MRVQKLLMTIVVFLFSVIGTSPGRGAGQLRYDVVDLGSLPGDWSMADKINDNGDISGVSRNAAGLNEAVVWRNGQIYGLGVTSAGTMIYVQINNCGLVSGWKYNDHRGFVMLPDPSTANSWCLAAEWQGGATGNNDLGQVAGWTESPLVAVIWSYDAGFTKLPLNDTYPHAYDISNNGCITGTYGSPSVSPAFRIMNGVFEDLGTLDGSVACGISVNNTGIVVGESNYSGGVNHAFVCEPGSPMADLGTLPGHRSSTAFYINNHNDISGVSHDSSGNRCACLWDIDGQITNLNDCIPVDAGWVLELAMCINDAGQIVGRGIHNGHTRAFLLTLAPFEVFVDIKPGSCPNPLNTKDKGVLPVAILGSEDLDVYTIDPVSIRLAGVAPTRSSYEDVAAPADITSECDCTEEGPDGYLDLTLKFNTQEIISALGPVEDGDEVVLRLTGRTFDGQEFKGTDCVLILDKGK